MINNDNFQDEIGENHIATSASNPVRKDAFDIPDDKKIELIKAKNPYWNENGKMILDPDGYRIIISDLKIE